MACQLEENRVDPLNVLRVLASLFVFEVHAINYVQGLGPYFQQGGLQIFVYLPAWGAVWIFFVLNGFLIGKGFASGKYEHSSRGILKFYKKRLLVTMLPVYCFSILCVGISNPSYLIENPRLILQYLTFTYNGILGVNGLIVCWYAFTIFWLWIISPFAAGILDRFRHRFPALMTAWVVLAFVGLGYRVAAYVAEFEWHTLIYTPPWANLDLFFGGMLAAYALDDFSVSNWKKRNSRWLRYSSVALLACVIITNCYINWRWSVYGGYLWRIPLSFIYRILYPSAYLVAVVLFLVAFDNPNQKGHTRLCLDMVRRNPLRLVDCFAAISFEFYLLHYFVLSYLAPWIRRDTPVATFAVLLASAFFVTCVLSVAFKQLFQLPKRIKSR